MGVAGDDGKMCSSGNANAGCDWGTAIAPVLAVLLAVAGVADAAELVLSAEGWAPLSASGGIYRSSSGLGLRDAARELGPDGPPELGGVVSDASTNSASSSESSESEERPPSS